MACAATRTRGGRVSSSCWSLIAPPSDDVPLSYHTTPHLCFSKPSLLKSTVAAAAATGGDETPSILQPAYLLHLRLPISHSWPRKIARRPRHATPSSTLSRPGEQNLGQLSDSSVILLPPPRRRVWRPRSGAPTGMTGHWTPNCRAWRCERDRRWCEDASNARHYSCNGTMTASFRMAHDS